MSGDRAPCPLCAAPSGLRLRRRGYPIYRCAACDFEFVHPVPTAAEIADCYEGDYFSGPGLGYGDYFGAERTTSDEKARVRLACLGELGCRSGRLLDVGCADGRFLRAARQQGFDCTGVEISERARAELPDELRGAVFASLDQALGAEPFELVTLWDTLEHLPDPLGTLRAIRHQLAPTALVAVVVPVIDNVNARFLPRSWDQYKPPEHLWFFSRRALRRTLERELDAELMLEQGAWRREARCWQVGLGHPRPLGVGRAEAALWRRAERLGWVAPAALEDSALLVVRHRSAAHAAATEREP